MCAPFEPLVLDGRDAFHFADSLTVYQRHEQTMDLTHESVSSRSAATRLLGPDISPEVRPVEVNPAKCLVGGHRR